MTETRTSLVDAVLIEITRVWGADGLQGSVPDLDDEEVMAFVEDDAAVIAFLHRFLGKYRSSATMYPG